MYDNNNIFAKIIDGKIPCKKIYEDKDVLFFEDINPVTKVHILGIPKVKCVDFSDFISNSGVDGGQEVPHFHIHILGGEKIGSKIR